MPQPINANEYTAGEALSANRLVNRSGANQVLLTTDEADLVIGITQGAIANGKQGLVYTSGLVTATAGAAIVAGVRLMSDTLGRVVTLNGTATNDFQCVGYAMESAAAADDTIEIMLRIMPWTDNTV